MRISILCQGPAEKWGWDDLPVDLLPQPEGCHLQEPVRSKASYVVKYGDDARIAVNFTKQAYWVYGLPLPKRNFTWAALEGPAAAWEACRVEIASFKAGA